MTIDEELKWYILRYRLRRLAEMERLAGRPPLTVRRNLRPRVGLLARLWRWVRRHA